MKNVTSRHQYRRSDGVSRYKHLKLRHHYGQRSTTNRQNEGAILLEKRFHTSIITANPRFLGRGFVGLAGGAYWITARSSPKFRPS